MSRIITVASKREEAILRQKTAPFDFSRFTRKEIKTLVADMRRTMKEAQGVGLAANQIALNLSVCIAHIDRKLYALFNPLVTKASEEADVMEEGCLSIPGVFGDVERPVRVWIEAQDAQGKKIKIKAFGLLARVLQHEIDHLNGILFTDKATNIHKSESA
jgi:peptide deformylase